MISEHDGLVAGASNGDGDELIVVCGYYSFSYVLLEEGRRLASGAAREPKIAPSHRLLAATAPGRLILRSQARKKVLAATSGHYPAPLAAIDVITAQQGLTLTSGLELGRRTIAPSRRAPSPAPCSASSR
jgi:hypothetical protein